MKDLLLLIVAILLFLFLGFGGFVYSATYYLFHEKNKQGSYCFRIAFGIDCFANIVGGEFIEALVSTERGLTSFGTNVSISACIGETIAENRFKAKYQWFSKLLDFVFNEKDHCVNAYRKEILKLTINNMKKVTIENSESSLVKRIKAETPDWFKKIRNIAGALAAMATAIKTAIPMLDGFVLHEPIPTILNYCIVAGIAVAAVSQTAKK